MFGIGLPEMILILALALIVVGPDKLPDLARSVAKGVMELKKTAETLKKSLNEDGNPLEDIKADLNQTTRTFNQNLLESDETTWKTRAPGEGVNPVAARNDSETGEAEPAAAAADTFGPDKPPATDKVNKTAEQAASPEGPSTPAAC